MMDGQFVNLNEENIEFDIESFMNNKYILTVSINGAGNMINIFEEYDDAVSAYIDIINDYDNGLIELFYWKGRRKHECIAMYNSKMDTPELQMI